jgi:hypothetical protein
LPLSALLLLGLALLLTTAATPASATSATPVGRSRRSRRRTVGGRDVSRLGLGSGTAISDLGFLHECILGGGDVTRTVLGQPLRELLGLPIGIG